MLSPHLSCVCRSNDVLSRPDRCVRWWSTPNTTADTAGRRWQVRSFTRMGTGARRGDNRIGRLPCWIRTRATASPQRRSLRFALTSIGRRWYADFLVALRGAQRIGVTCAAAAKYQLPTPDAVVGPVNTYVTLPRSTTRGCRLATIEAWHAQRPGCVARIELYPRMST